MNAKKTLLAGLALAALTVAGLSAADARPRDHYRGPVRHVVIHDHFRGPPVRAYVSPAHVHRVLRQHRYVAIGAPYFLGSRYVVRTHDRFGRTVLVRIDPWTGRFLGVVRV